jgi:site-specific recombinase XerD
MSNFTFKFYLNKAKSASGKAPIYLRLIICRKKAEMATGLMIMAKEWDSDKQRATKNQVINASLNEIENRLYQVVMGFNKNNEAYSAIDLKEQLVNRTPDDHFLLEYFQKFVDKLKIANEVEKSTIKSYDKAKWYLTEFIRTKYNKEDYKIGQIDYSFVSEFDLFLLESGLQRNTITKHEKKVKSVLLKAQREKLIVENPYQDFKLKSTSGKRQFLTQQEIDSIINHSLAENESLKRIRDIFIFSVFTGLRFTDAMNLKSDQIKTDSDGSCFLEIYQNKTSEPVMIPIFPQAMEIIKKYQSVEKNITGKVLPHISNQKLNAYLKTIADLCGIDKPLTHHIARHSCATTILLSNNVPIEAVSKWLGHTSIKTTQIYAKISPQYLKQVANNIVKKQSHGLH